MHSLESLDRVCDSDPNPFHAHSNTAFVCARGSAPVQDMLWLGSSQYFAKFTPMNSERINKTFIANAVAQ